MQEDLNQLKVVIQIQKLFIDVQEVEKTIFIYDIYSQDNAKALQNLHSLSCKLLYPEVQIEVKQTKKSKKITEYFHQVNLADFLKKQDNKINQISLQQDKNINNEQYTKIRAYTSIYSGQKVRIVAIPIYQNHLMNGDGLKMKQQIENIRKQSYQQTKSIPDVKQRQAIKAKYDELSKNKKQQFVTLQQKNQCKIFKLESIIYNFIQKTKKISICRPLQFEQQENQKKFKEAQSVMDILINSAKSVKRHYIYYLVDTEIYQQNTNKKINIFKQSVSTVFGYNFEQKKVSLLKGGITKIFKDQYFTEQKIFSTNIYKIKKQNNPFMAENISKFVNIWSNIIKQAITPIEPLLRGVYQDVFNSLNLQTSNKNIKKELFPQSSIIKIQQTVGKTYNFEKIFAKYIDKASIQPMEQINLQASNSYQKKVLQKFYQQENISMHQQKQTKNLNQIQGIAFLHDFSKANKSFLSNFSIYEDKNKTYSQSIKSIKDYIIKIVRLLHISENKLLQKQSLRQYKCQNLQKYCNFVIFLLKSSVSIDNITNCQVATTSFIKSFFQALLFSDNWFFSYIISKQKSIKPLSSIKYYNFLLQFIQEDCTAQHFSKIQDIYLTIQKYKADKISQEISVKTGRDYQDYKCRIVEAIQSYSIFVLLYNKLNLQNQNKYDKLIIEKKIASLLMIIDQPQQAVKIYQRNHFVTKVDSCFKQIILNYSIKERTNKLIQFGNYFQNEFFYTEAKWYYQKAYDTAVSKEDRRSAYISLMKCRENQMSSRKYDLEFIKNYTQKGCSQEDFLASNFGQFKNDVRAEAKLHYQFLRDKKQWNKKSLQQIKCQIQN